MRGQKEREKLVLEEEGHRTSYENRHEGKVPDTCHVEKVVHLLLEVLVSELIQLLLVCYLPSMAALYRTGSISILYSIQIKIPSVVYSGRLT